MSLARSLSIGITIGLHHAAESLWVNGIKQNALYLMKLFQHSPLGHQVTLVNTTNVKITSELPWDTTQYPIRSFDDAKDSLDVLIELGGQIDQQQTAYLQVRGTKVVSYCCGPEYVHMMQAMIFGRRHAETVFINQRYDQVWIIPQVVDTSASYFSVLRRQPVREVPFVWDPMCVEERSAALPHHGEYRPTGQPKRLSVMEPNIDVTKFCLYPLLIAELGYRKFGEKIAYVHATNTEHLAKNSPEFIGIAHHLDLVRDSKISFVGYYNTPQFLSEFTDIVISHQSGLALNYFYFDVCWNGYALIHNAYLCRELGYFYNEQDAEEGALQLGQAIDSHDEKWVDYKNRQREFIGGFLSTNSKQIESYDRLLVGLFD
ncbi:MULTISPECIES: DUF2827 domain-containing protein [Burkholderia]|uniref:DUF2827 domain-containing protein n=1 Tax=Burkholderia TaxID=32008 RepID=UPI0008639183|nr:MULTISPECIES: DUF2827 domain-containing protein [Burkholderia]AOL08513.1 hypothetical protein WI95_31055 [Burkholderia contaminans]ELK6461941.1 DUF2827 domain-containing protein [Burkholderia contaminans]MCA7882389.1 DUF2827 domain-containing protein [Burkholderia contaminans]TCW72309.1 DUF2827 domain-containing protein [Burkholderia sp. SRS-25]